MIGAPAGDTRFSFSPQQEKEREGWKLHEWRVIRYWRPVVDQRFGIRIRRRNHDYS